MIHCPKCGEDWSEVAAIRAATKERDATIARLRAALEEILDLRTSSSLSKQIARSALATAKEAGK